MVPRIRRLTPDGALATLGTMQPTSKFGEMFPVFEPARRGAEGSSAVTSRIPSASSGRHTTQPWRPGYSVLSG